MSRFFGKADPSLAQGKQECLPHRARTRKLLDRKEVIQPQVLLRLPCYDFTPIRDHTVGAGVPCGFGRRLLVQPPFVM